MSENATFTPMEGPEWLNPVIDDYWNDFNQVDPETGIPWNRSAYLRGWEDVRGAGDQLVNIQQELAPMRSQGAWDATNRATEYTQEMLGRILSGEAVSPELSADSGYMQNYMGMVATPEDYESFMADPDYYTELAQQLLSPIELGYGGQSLSFIPGSSAEAYASILGSIMDTQEEAGRAYGSEKEEALESYSPVLGSLLAGRQGDQQIYSGMIANQAFYDMMPYEYYYADAQLPYQTLYDVAQTNPAGSWWTDAMNDYYNQWAPMELSRYYATPSYELDTNTSVLDMLSQIMGMAGVGNQLGVFDMLGDAGSWIGDLFGGGSSSSTDLSSIADAFGSSLTDIFSDTDWLSGLSW